MCCGTETPPEPGKGPPSAEPRGPRQGVGSSSGGEQTLKDMSRGIRKQRLPSAAAAQGTNCRLQGTHEKAPGNAGSKTWATASAARKGRLRMWAGGRVDRTC